MSKKPYKHVMVEFDTIYIYPGETLTVWLHQGGRGSACETTQIELRVTEEGKPEMFCDSLKGKSFDRWKPLKEQT